MLCIFPFSRIFYVCHDSLDLETFDYITQDVPQDTLHHHGFQEKDKAPSPRSIQTYQCPQFRVC